MPGPEPGSSTSEGAWKHGIVTRRDDDFLARVEPSVEPRGGGREHGSSGYAEGLRSPKAERRASLEPGGAEQVHNKRREAMHKLYVVGAGVMGAAVVAAAAVAVLVFAGVIAVSPGTSGGNRRAEALKQRPSSTTTPPSSPSTTTEAPSPSTAAETGRSPLRPSHPVAIPDTTTGEQVPARPSSNSGGSEQLSSASSPTPSGASAPGAPTAPALSGDDRTDRRHHGLQLPKAQPHITTAVSNEPRHT
jgi:cytoskeletal protein RodZ